MLDFGTPLWLFGLLGVVPLTVLLIVRLGEAWRYRQAFAPRVLWERMRLAGDEIEVFIRSVAAILAIVLLVVALADPREAGRARTEDGADLPRLLILLDSSKSMLAADTLYGGSPVLVEGRGATRFDAAKSLAGDLIRNLHGWQTGLIVFAAEPWVLCPVTADQTAALTLLGRAKAGDSSLKGGSNIENALRAAAALLGNNRGAVLLLSDGEELSGQALGLASALARKKVRVHAVGIGSTEQVPIRLETGAPLTWRGATVMTSRNDALLSDLARRTGGHYWPAQAFGSGVAGTPAGLEVAGGMGAPTGRSQPGNSHKGVPMGLALAILAADALWVARHGSGRLGLRLLAMWLGFKPARVAAALVALLVAGWTWPSIPYVQKGLEAYRQGEASRSVELFEEAAKRDDAPEIRYDLGNAYHLAGRYAKSLGAHKESLKTLAPKSRLAGHTHYNMGNSHFRLGDYRSAIVSYKKALRIDPRDEDALHNLGLAESRLSKDRQTMRGGSKASPGRQQLGVIPMPDADEAAALLSQLEEDERRRQAEASLRDSRADGGQETPSQLARRLLKEAEQSVTRHLEKDW